VLWAASEGLLKSAFTTNGMRRHGPSAAAIAGSRSVVAGELAAEEAAGSRDGTDPAGGVAVAAGPLSQPIAATPRHSTRSAGRARGEELGRPSLRLAMSRGSVAEVATPGTRCDHAFVPLPTGPAVTFLFSDIEGSTRLERSVGSDAWPRLVARHDDLLRTTIK